MTFIVAILACALYHDDERCTQLINDSEVNCLGTHGLSCQWSEGCYSCNAAIKDIIYPSLNSADVPSTSCLELSFFFISLMVEVQMAFVSFLGSVVNACCGCYHPGYICTISPLCCGQRS